MPTIYNVVDKLIKLNRSYCTWDRIIVDLTNLKYSLCEIYDYTEELNLVV